MFYEEIIHFSDNANLLECRQENMKWNWVCDMHENIHESIVYDHNCHRVPHIAVNRVISQGTVEIEWNTW